MVFNKFLISIIICISPWEMHGYVREKPLKWAITKGCSLRVNGSTNINKFSCQVAGYTRKDTLVISNQQAEDGVYKMKGFLSLDVLGFDCHHAIMTADLRKTLKAKEYPTLLIRFKNLSGLPQLQQQEDQLNGQVAITLSGVTKIFTVDYRISRDQDKVITLSGSRAVTFTDFGIVPPRKLGGMIRTNDQLDIQFTLKMVAID